MQLLLTTGLLAQSLISLASAFTRPEGIPDGAYIVKSLNVTRDIKPTSVAKRDHGDFHRTGGGKQWCKPFTGNRAFYCWGPSRCEATIVNGYTSTETWNGDAKVQLGSLQAGLGYSSSHSVNVQTNYKADQGPGECCTWAMTPEMAWICGWKEGSCIFAPGWGAPPICEKDSDVGCLNRPTGRETWNYWCWKAPNDQECARSYQKQADTPCLDVEVSY